MFFQLVLKDFKLKKLAVEPKTAQPIELDDEPVDPEINRSQSESTPSSIGRGPVERFQKLSLSPNGLLFPVEVILFPVEVRLRPNGHLPNIKC